MSGLHDNVCASHKGHPCNCPSAALTPVRSEPLLDAVRQERMRWELEATVQRVCQHGDEMAVVRHFIASNIAKGIKIAEDIIASNATNEARETRAGRNA